MEKQNYKKKIKVLVLNTESVASHSCTEEYKSAKAGPESESLKNFYDIKMLFPSLLTFRLIVEVSDTTKVEYGYKAGIKK